MRDRGSMLVLVVFVGVAVTSAAIVAMVPVLDDLGDRQRARSAADAAALAGVTGGAAASAELAHANGAMIVAWRRVDGDVLVDVRVGDQVARARASDRP